MEPKRKTHLNPFWYLVGLTFQMFSSPVSHLSRRKRFDPASIEITRLRLSLPRLHPAFDGFRLVHISDIHMGTWMTGERLQAIVQLINQQQPDVVAITGDFVSYTAHKTLQQLKPPLKALVTREATLAVLGNHDHWTNSERIRQTLRVCNIVEIGNRVFTLRRGAGMLHFAGVDDALNEPEGLEKVLAALPEEGAAILLAHHPDFADISAATGRFDLQLSGHSHGGQIILPKIGPLLLPRLAKKYPSGHYRVNGMVQYTNRGLGTTSLQLRWNCPPEITVLTLRAAQSL